MGPWGWWRCAAYPSRLRGSGKGGAVRSRPPPAGRGGVGRGSATSHTGATLGGVVGSPMRLFPLSPPPAGSNGSTCGFVAGLRYSPSLRLGDVPRTAISTLTTSESEVQSAAARRALAGSSNISVTRSVTTRQLLGAFGRSRRLIVSVTSACFRFRHRNSFGDRP